MSDNIYVIYKHTSPSGKSYIGITKHYDRRCMQHSRVDGSSPKFHHAIRKYGWEAFTHEVLATNLTLEEARELEQMCINKWNTIKEGYNTHPGGDIPVGILNRGVLKTEDHITSIEHACKDRVQTLEQKIMAYVKRWKVSYEQAAAYFATKQVDPTINPRYGKSYYGYHSVKKSRRNTRGSGSQLDPITLTHSPEHLPAE